MSEEKKDLEFKKRRLELASKFMKMGRSLIKEGEETGFENAEHAGGTLILLSGLMLDDDDMSMFQFLCSMFSAKQMFDNMKESPLAGMMMGLGGGGLGGNPNDNMDFLDKMMDKLNRENKKDDTDEDSSE